MLIINPSSAMVAHRGASGGAGPSPGIWGLMTAQAASPDDSGFGRFVSDDFMSIGLLAATNDTTFMVSEAGLYTQDIGTGCTILQLATASGGVVRFSMDNTGNDESYLQYGPATGVLGAISDTAADAKRTCFEARFRVSSVATSGIFIGLTEEANHGNDVMVDDTTVLKTTTDWLGMHIAYTAPTVPTFKYQKASAAVQTPVTAAVDANGDAVVLAADTWYKAGFAYNPDAPADKKIKFFFNGVEQGGYVTAANIAATTFPDGEEMTFNAGIKTVAATATTMDLDWWYFYQEA